MQCLDASGLFELFGSAARAPERAAMEAHLDRCDRCRELVAAYARVGDESTSDTEEQAAPTVPVALEAASAAKTRRREGAVILGRFRLERVVGEGGMAVVWAAKSLATGERAALKILKVETHELAHRALREAEVAHAIGHPNILEIREVLVDGDGAPILVMDLLEGESLDRLLARAGPLSLSAALAILTPLVSAVRAAHARGVLHRDLKPQNVFLARERPDVDPVVMLLDFGLAKILGGGVETLTKTGAIVGTPHYMAPEQLYGEPDIDARADVWAIGAVAYECLSGKRPLEGSSYPQILRNASRRAVAPLAEVVPTAPLALTTLVDAMLSHARADRPELARVHATLDALARGA